MPSKQEIEAAAIGIFNEYYPNGCGSFKDTYESTDESHRDNLKRAATAALEAAEKVCVDDSLKIMGMLNVLCECHVFVPEEQREMIQDAVADNLPEGWAVKRIVNRLELVLPTPPEGE